ncbi:uncharacterized protein LOC106154525 [Lingula anatina]|uniref:Uncharacterized protein LOC106154525 n=1 Tax=Lingula anatina TaxID=7574 RepID=A0A1S3HH45_LINAN|nr:uncharacterized protein LOC106154525 [Lingula anatina]|eukprot:XP_013384349.1 uncharacterized protein LOC106154525 [Lingula anatina]
MYLYSESIESGPVSFMFQDAGKTAFLLRDLHRLYYSYEEGTENGVMTLLNCNTSDLVEEGEFIQEVTISPLREIIIHTSRNHLFHSKMKMNQVLKLESGELPSSDVVVRFDALDRMYLMVLENGTLTSRIYPLKNEISSGLFPLQQCPVS